MPDITVLLVDNHQETLLALKASLAPLPCRIETAESGDQALKAVLRGGIDLALLDVVMPGMTGIEVARYLHRLDQTRHIPVILMTGMVGQARLTEEAYEIGVADLIIKPVSPWLLRLKIAGHLRYLRRIRELEAPDPA
ncbi:response regulator [Streptomyces endophyticus]|uniref:Response regulator n=1 Tax=Streptomyces endophyticus TaxID=714166 RepID=A0ABU6F7H4_9ACTN|nr:response regulator [Streptomyces endophyticus]MEB8339418.1 response regulator [Streptomyces endophyticus]